MPTISNPTLNDIETLVISRGNPEELILSTVDWWATYKVCDKSCLQRDANGVFLKVISTKLRPKSNGQQTTVDASSETLFSVSSTADVKEGG